MSETPTPPPFAPAAPGQSSGLTGPTEQAAAWPAPGWPPPSGTSAMGAPLPGGPPARRGSWSVAAAVLALLVAAFGEFALPLTTYQGPVGDVGFAEVRSVAAFLGGRRLALDSTYTEFGAFWWRYGALIGFAVLGLLVVGAVAGAATRALGLLLALVAVAVGALQALALARTPDFRAMQQFFRAHGSDMYDHAGAGVIVAFVGLALVAAAGVWVAALRGP